MEANLTIGAQGGGGGGLTIGNAVRIPDGRCGIVRWVYPGERGPNLIVRTDEGTMLVLPAARCSFIPRMDGGGGGGI